MTQIRVSFLFVLLFLIARTVAFAQLSEDEARRLYEEAEQQYESQNYYDCYQQCLNLNRLMGKNTPKVFYLMIKAINNNLSEDKEKGKNKLTKSYENYTKFYDYTSIFLRLVDKKTYPAERMQEIEAIHKSFESGVSLFEYQRGRKPEDAVSFLNECARKFPRKQNGTFETVISNTVQFTFVSPYLRVIASRVYRNNGISTGSESYVVRVTFIDLSKITGLLSEPFNSGKDDCPGCITWGFTGLINTVKAPYGPESKMTTVDGIIESYRASFVLRKKPHHTFQMLYSDTTFLPEQAFRTWQTMDQVKGYLHYKNNPSNLHIFSPPVNGYDGSLFDQTSVEFKQGNYETRIKEAIQYLIDYVPKKQTAPSEGSKIDRSSKF